MTSRPLAALLGDNCRRLRERVGATQDELARCARGVGLRWDAAKVRRFESGEVAPGFATVLAVSLALQLVSAERLKAGEQIDWCYRGLADLLEPLDDDEYVGLTDAFPLRPAVLQQACSGMPWDTSAITGDAVANITAAVDELAAVIGRQGLAEQRLAKRCGISVAQLAQVTHELWGGTFSEERDRRLAPGANQQARSQMTRRLQAELEKEFAGGDDK